MRRDVALIPLYLWVSASILLHIVSDFGLNEVGERARLEEARRAAQLAARARAAPVEIDYIPTPTPPPPPTPVAVTPPAADPAADLARPEHAPTPVAQPAVRAVHPPAPRPVLARRTPPAPQVRRTPLAAQPPRPQPTPRVAANAPTPPPQPRPQALPRMQHVDQENENHEQRPTDPAFLAQSNHDVREQTVAQVRNLERNQSSPQLGGTPADHHADREGNGAHDVSADDRDRHGDSHANPDTSLTPQTRPASTPRLASAAPGAGAPANGGAARAEGREGREGRAGESGQQGAAGPGELSSAMGTMRGVMTEAEGEGGSINLGNNGSGGGQVGEGGQQGQGGHDGHNGQHGTAAQRVGIAGLGAAGAMAALTPSFTTYQQVFGPRIEQERAVATLRRSQARGNYTDSWRENRSAIENFTPSVRVGNQTALRTAQSPFSAYLTSMHRRIHRHYADGFLAGLESAPANSPLNDTSLVTTLEIILEHDGRIHRLGVVNTSGFTPFDVAALNSVRRAAPFGEAPAQILSGDGRVYMHWGFYRNERECGTFNVDPYILPDPGASGPRDHDPVPVPHTPGPDRVGDATPSTRPQQIATR